MDQDSHTLYVEFITVQTPNETQEPISANDLYCNE